jgi:hypothetical protein
MFNILAIKEIEIKRLLRSHIIAIRMAIIKNKNTLVTMQRKDPSYIVDGNVISTTTMESSMLVPQKYKYRTII